jgi:predicted hotdog family 3-hydroxylacyl-ACP dehydratase
MPFPPVEALLPHAPPMRLIDSITEEIEGGLVCKVVVDDGFVFLRDGEAELAVCIELVAQCIGCLAGLRDLRRGSPPRPGLLVGCRDARFHGEKLRAGDELAVKVETQWIREPVGNFRGQVKRRGDVVAEVEVMVISTDGDLVETIGAFRG